MRTPEEIFDLILTTAREDDRIRGVYMNGSRANPNAPVDQYQDFDIVYATTDTLSFVNDKEWLRRFGETAIVQEPDLIDTKLGIPGFNFSRRYAWLMLFKDGNRIDLSVQLIEEARKNVLEDKMTVVLLDKDGIFPELPPSSDEDYHVRKPSQAEFEACSNEFWWCLNNVAKGIHRDELPYVMEMFNVYVRAMLNKMTGWYIGMLTGFSVSTGKMGKYYKKYLPEQAYCLYASTYSDSSYDHIWNSVAAACDLFRKMTEAVAKEFNFTFDSSEDINMTEYLQRMKNEQQQVRKLPEITTAPKTEEKY